MLIHSVYPYTCSFNTRQEVILEHFNILACQFSVLLNSVSELVISLCYAPLGFWHMARVTQTLGHGMLRLVFFTTQ